MLSTLAQDQKRVARATDAENAALQRLRSNKKKWESAADRFLTASEKVSSLSFGVYPCLALFAVQCAKTAGSLAHFIPFLVPVKLQCKIGREVDLTSTLFPLLFWNSWGVQDQRVEGRACGRLAYMHMCRWGIHETLTTCFTWTPGWSGRRVGPPGRLVMPRHVRCGNVRNYHVWHHSANCSFCLPPPCLLSPPRSPKMSPSTTEQGAGPGSGRHAMLPSRTLLPKGVGEVFALLQRARLPLPVPPAFFETLKVDVNKTPRTSTELTRKCGRAGFKDFQSEV